MRRNGFNGIKALAFDVDGVFTDGGILCDCSGELYRTFDAKDGFGVRMAVMQGLPVGIITGGASSSIRARFLTCGIGGEDIYLAVRKKIEALDDFCLRHGLSRKEVLFAGDDLPDIEAMLAAGVGACPADAVVQVRKIADFVSDRPGGKGFVRQVVEKVLKVRGDWRFDAETYRNLF